MKSILIFDVCAATLQEGDGLNSFIIFIDTEADLDLNLDLVYI